ARCPAPSSGSLQPASGEGIHPGRGADRRGREEDARETGGITHHRSNRRTDRPCGFRPSWEDIMIKTTRRRVLQGTLGLAAASTFYIPRFAGAAEFNYKYSNNLAPSHPMNIRAKEAVDRIREETDGRVSIEIFPASQLGTDPDVLSQLRAGGVEFFTLAGALLSSLVPLCAIDGMAYAFPDYPTVWKAMDGDLGALIRAEISKYGIVAMDKVWDNGFHQITTRATPINTPAD